MTDSKTIDWPEGLAIEVPTGPAAVSDLVDEAKQRAESERLARRSEVAADVEALDFRKVNGYPIDAKRLPAGTYRITGVDVYNHVDPTHPDGVRPCPRGSMVDLTEHQASRLLFIDAIDDPDAPAPTVAGSPPDVARQMERVLGQMREQVATQREKQADNLPRLEARRRHAKEAADEAAAHLAALDTEIAETKRLQKATDDEVATSFGEQFVETMQRLERGIADMDALAAS